MTWNKVGEPSQLCRAEEGMTPAIADTVVDGNYWAGRLKSGGCSGFWVCNLFFPPCN